MDNEMSAGEVAGKLRAAEAEIARLSAKVDQLSRPTLWWIDEDPEVGFADPWEARESALYHSDDEGIAILREGRELGIRYYAKLLPFGDDDEEWEADFDSFVDAEVAINAERERRAHLAAQVQS